MARLRGMDDALGAIFARDLADGAPRTPGTVRARTVSAGLDLGSVRRLDGTPARHLRLTVEDRWDRPAPIRFAVYGDASGRPRGR